jgi:hypothetical protein
MRSGMAAFLVRRGFSVVITRIFEKEFKKLEL